MPGEAIDKHHCDLINGLRQFDCICGLEHRFLVSIAGVDPAPTKIAVSLGLAAMLHHEVNQIDQLFNVQLCSRQVFKQTASCRHPSSGL